jgi:hypothetical protein
MTYEMSSAKLSLLKRKTLLSTVKDFKLVQSNTKAGTVLLLPCGTVAVLHSAALSV